jgi:hypothetical protein
MHSLVDRLQLRRMRFGFRLDPHADLNSEKARLVLAT